MNSCGSWARNGRTTKQLCSCWLDCGPRVLSGGTKPRSPNLRSTSSETKYLKPTRTNSLKHSRTWSHIGAMNTALKKRCWGKCCSVTPAWVWMPGPSRRSSLVRGSADSRSMAVSTTSSRTSSLRSHSLNSPRLSTKGRAWSNSKKTLLPTLLRLRMFSSRKISLL